MHTHREQKGPYKTENVRTEPDNAYSASHRSDYAEMFHTAYHIEHCAGNSINKSALQPQPDPEYRKAGYTEDSSTALSVSE